MGELEGEVWGISKVELAEPEDEEETETERALTREEEIGIGSEC
jgi:vacuolar-type H+-ATPase subunit F/Vma7